MNMVALFLFIISVVAIVVFIKDMVNRKPKQKAEPEEIVDASIYELYRNFIELNNDSFEALKAMIKASIETSSNNQTNRWD